MRAVYAGAESHDTADGVFFNPSLSGLCPKLPNALECPQLAITTGDEAEGSAHTIVGDMWLQGGCGKSQANATPGYCRDLTCSACIELEQFVPGNVDIEDVVHVGVKLQPPARLAAMIVYAL